MAAGIPEELGTVSMRPLVVMAHATNPPKPNLFPSSPAQRIRNPNWSNMTTSATQRATANQDAARTTRTTFSSTATSRESPTVPGLKAESVWNVSQTIRILCTIRPWNQHQMPPNKKFPQYPIVFSLHMVLFEF